MQVKHENLRVWAEAMDLSELVYAMSREFPRREDFGLTAQIRRSGVLLDLSLRLKYLSQMQYSRLREASERVLIALSGLIRSLERRTRP